MIQLLLPIVKKYSALYLAHSDNVVFYDENGDSFGYLLWEEKILGYPRCDDICEDTLAAVADAYLAAHDKPVDCEGMFIT